MSPASVKSRLVFNFLVLAHPEKGPLNAHVRVVQCMQPIKGFAHGVLCELTFYIKLYLHCIYITLPMDTGKQTDGCFVMHAQSPRRCNINDSVTVT